MSVLNTLPAPVIQMGLVEKIVEVQQNQPHVQQLVAQETARHAWKDEQSRVGKTEKQEEGRKVREREAGQNKKESRSSGREPRLAREQESENRLEPDAENSGVKPWTGHLLNITV